MIVYLGENNEHKIQVAVRCKKCKKLQMFDVTMLEWYELMKYLDKRSELHIQEILPNVSDDIRECFISGICGKCFDEMFDMVVNSDD